MCMYVCMHAHAHVLGQLRIAVPLLAAADSCLVRVIGRTVLYWIELPMCICIALFTRYLPRVYLVSVRTWLISPKVPPDKCEL